MSWSEAALRESLSCSNFGLIRHLCAAGSVQCLGRLPNINSKVGSSKLACSTYVSQACSILRLTGAAGETQFVCSYTRPWQKRALSVNSTFLRGKWSKYHSYHTGLLREPDESPERHVWPRGKSQSASSLGKNWVDVFLSLKSMDVCLHRGLRWPPQELQHLSTELGWEVGARDRQGPSKERWESLSGVCWFCSLSPSANPCVF